MSVMAPVETFQSPFELDLLAGVYERLGARNVLEVGAWKGGTLWHWLQAPRVSVTVIDDAMRDSDEWSFWAEATSSNLHLLRGTSQDTTVVDKARELGPYDFVFIDGDHSYDAVKADWDNYRPMVADGGVIALHDILPRPSYGVWRLWDEIKNADGARYMEICQNETLPGNEGRCGVGLLWV